MPFFNPSYNPFTSAVNFDPMAAEQERKKKMANLAFTPQPGDPTVANPMPAKDPGFMDNYKKLTSDTPYTNQFADAIKNAPTSEQYQPNKTARLGAILSGVGASFKDPGAGASVTQSLLDAPFKRAQAEHQMKLGNLSALAGMEDAKMGRDIKALEYDDKSKSDDRREAFDREKFKETQKLNNAQIDNWVRDNDRQDLKEGTDPVTGEHYLTNIRTGAKIHVSDGESLDAKLKRLKAEDDIRTDNDMRASAAIQAQENARLDKTLASQERRADAKNKTAEAVAALRKPAANGKLDPYKDELAQVLMEAKDALGRKYGVNIDDLYTVDQFGLPTVQPSGRYFKDDANTSAAKQELQQMLASIKKDREAERNGPQPVASHIPTSATKKDTLGIRK